MQRISKKLALIIVVCGLMVVTFATPVAGQIDPGEISDLETRRDEIVVFLGELDVTVADLGERVEEFRDAVAVSLVEIELIADDLELAVDARREPARTRLQIAIAGFVGGDPRQSALIDEMEAIQGSDEPAQRREMYGAVIDDAMARLADIDERLVDLGDKIVTSRHALTEAETELADVELELTQAGALRTALAIELDEVRSRIQRLRDLANRSVLTGLTTYDDPSRPALAIKIDNIRAAMPQSGINQADIVFVEEVEGGLTRLAAVFHSTGAEVVGPIRSMRTGDFDLLAQFNSPLFANSGGNRGARAALAQSTLIDIGAESTPDGYYRETARPRPHDLMANTFNLWALGAGSAANTPSPMFLFRDPGSSAGPGARVVSGFTSDYGTTRVSYDWTGSGWARSQDGQPTVDTDGVRVTPTTVIVQVTTYGVSQADARSPEAVTIGSGFALIFTEGQVVEARWRRAELDDQTEYVDGDGNPLSILRGRTWIELPRPERTTIR